MAPFISSTGTTRSSATCNTIFATPAATASTGVSGFSADKFSLNTAAFAAPPLDRPGTAGPMIVQAPGLQLIDVSLRKQYRIDERFRLRFQADLFNAFDATSWAGFATGTGGNGNLIQTGRPGDAIYNFTPGPPRQLQLSLAWVF